MIRIAGVSLPQKKRIQIALTYIYGIGKSSATKILKEANIDINKTTDTLDEKEENSLRQVIEKMYRVEGELRRMVFQNIKILKEINSYRGSRHKRNLPVRGQRTKTNSRSVRGNVRKTMGSGRVKTQKT
jgi:small subunit ribosomal protein S13